MSTIVHCTPSPLIPPRLLTPVHASATAGPRVQLPGSLHTLPPHPSLPANAGSCLLLPGHACYCRVMPAAAGSCLLLPGHACCCRVMPATAGSCLPAGGSRAASRAPPVWLVALQADPGMQAAIGIAVLCCVWAAMIMLIPDFWDKVLSTGPLPATLM